MPFFITHYRNRTQTFRIELFDADGEPFLLSADDSIIVQIYRVASLPELDIRSGEIEPGGSKIEFSAGTNEATLTLSQGDTRVVDLETGAYEIEIIVVDSSHILEEDLAGTAAAKFVELGVLFIHPSGLGAIPEEESSSSS